MASAKSTNHRSEVVDEHAWVIIPLFNEATVIARVVSELKTKFRNVVCIDDGSSDNSASVASEAGAIVIKHPFNMGQGAALQTGITFARQQPGVDFIVTFDADGQHRIEDAQGMIELARAHRLGIVFGSRFLDDRTQPGLLKKIVLKTAVFVSNMSSAVKLTDAHNGLRAISVEAAQQVELQQDRMAHASEIVVQLGKTQLPWEEFPVEVIYTDYSRAKGQSLLNSVNIIVDLIVN